MQFLSTSENQILAPGVAVGGASLTSAALPTSAAPGDVVTVLPNKGGFKIQAGSVNGVAAARTASRPRSRSLWATPAPATPTATRSS